MRPKKKRKNPRLGISQDFDLSDMHARVYLNVQCILRAPKIDGKKDIDIGELWVNIHHEYALFVFLFCKAIEIESVEIVERSIQKLSIPLVNAKRWVSEILHVFSFFVTDADLVIFTSSSISAPWLPYAAAA